MAAFSQASSILFPSSSHTHIKTAFIRLLKITTNNLAIFTPKKIASNISLVDDQQMINESSRVKPNNVLQSNAGANQDLEAVEKLYVILEAVMDRVEMHKNIGEQRNNWNSLLLTSVNSITLSAAILSAIAAVIASVPGAPVHTLKLSSTFMYLAATGLLIIMNKFQPSQLAEEQRNAARLFKQLEMEIKTKITISNPTVSDVNEAMSKVLALDRAYPLPLLGVMIEKFPNKIEPAVWWPETRLNASAKSDCNRSVELEEEMREIARILEVKDKADYLRLGQKALKLNKVLAIAGPLLTGLGAVGSMFLGSSRHDSWAVLIGVMGGAMASGVSSVQHGGQVGMVFEMYRSNAGFFKKMKESIELGLEERDVEGEVFEMKVALQLGRSLSELKDLAAASSSRKGVDEDVEEFGSKLF